MLGALARPFTEAQILELRAGIQDLGDNNDEVWNSPIFYDVAVCVYRSLRLCLS